MLAFYFVSEEWLVERFSAKPPLIFTSADNQTITSRKITTRIITTRIITSGIIKGKIK
jgi:hypothetical protein